MTNTVDTLSTRREKPSLLAVNLFLLVGIFIILYLGNKSETVFPQYLLSVLAEVILALITLGFMRAEKLPARETLRLRWPGWRPIALSMVLAIGLWMMGVILNVFTTLLFGYVTPLPPSAFPKNVGEVFLLLLATTIAAPICEEIMFRGYVQRAYERWGAWTGLMISGFIFALYHLRFQGMFALLPVSFALGFVAWRSHSLLPGIMLHAVYNSIASVLLIASSFFPMEIVTAMTAIIACAGLLMVPLALLAIYLFWQMTHPPHPAPVPPRAGWRRWAWLVPLLLLALIYGYASVSEIVLGQFPEVLAAEALNLEAPQAWETDQYWTYEIRNKLNQTIGEATCALTNPEDEFILMCQAQQSAFALDLPIDIPALDTALSVEAGEWQHTATWNQEDLHLVSLNSTRESAGQVTDLTLYPTAGAGRLVVTPTTQAANEIPVATDVLLEEEWPWRLAALPFDIGYGVHVPFVHIDQEGAIQVQKVYVGVQGAEPVWTPADNFVAWKVFLTYEDDAGQEHTRTAWYHVEAPHTLLRYDDSRVTYLLSELKPVK